MLADIVALAREIVGNPAVLLGIISLIGLLLQKKGASDVVKGTFRTMLGVVLIIVGTDIFARGVAGFQQALAALFGMSPPSGAEMGLAEFIVEYGGYAALAMLAGFALHLVLTTMTRRFVYLTGHIMWWVSLSAFIGLKNAFPNANDLALVGVASVMVGVYLTVQPAVLHRYMTEVMGSDEIAYGHSSSFIVLLSSLLAPLVGDRRKTVESLKLPSHLEWLKDYETSTAVILAAVIIPVAVLAPGNAIEGNPSVLGRVLWGLLTALEMTAGIIVMIHGVRMFLDEIVPAFRGISSRIKGARPALDCIVVFPKSPMAAVVGFLSGTAVFTAIMLASAALRLFPLVPPVVILFFPGGAAGIFGNKRGGWRGAVAGGALNGAFLALAQAVTWNMLSYAPEITAMADPDWFIMIWAAFLLRALLSILSRIA